MKNIYMQNIGSGELKLNAHCITVTAGTGFFVTNYKQ